MQDSTIPRALKAASRGNANQKGTSPPGWLLPAGLITLGVIPILANTLRRVALSLGATDASSNDGNSGLPLPVVVHVVSAAVYVILGAFQFTVSFRQRKLSWHRIAGRVLLVAGLLVALSGIWLGGIAAWSGESGQLLYLFRLLAGLGMAICIVLGFAAIMRRDLPSHRAWMIRAYALGLAAGTQVFTVGFGGATFGKSDLSLALLNGAGWLINLVVAELAIRRRSGDRDLLPAGKGRSL